MKLLELFSGTHSVSRALQNKHSSQKLEVVSLDVSPKYNPTIVSDILLWNYKQYPTFYFDIIWASPPCTHYSKANRRGVRNLHLADKLVKRTLKIIHYFKPKYWFIENPADGGLLQHRPFMKSLYRYKHTCCYCKYKFLYKKKTNIWTNKPNLHFKICDKYTPCIYKKIYNKHLLTAQRTKSSNSSSGQGLHDVSLSFKIPPLLIRSII